MLVLETLVEVAAGVLHTTTSVVLTNIAIRDLFGNSLTSPNVMEFFMRLPDAFDVEIKDDETADTFMLDSTLADLANYIERHGIGMQ